jgi:hypothetical protein
MTDTPCCANCLSSTPALDGKGKIDFTKRVCKHNPPLPMLVPNGAGGAGMDFFWPILGNAQWCRKHEPRAVVIEQPLPGEKVALAAADPEKAN